jgi:hypothetical protein
MKKFPGRGRMRTGGTFNHGSSHLAALGVSLAQPAAPGTEAEPAGSLEPDGADDGVADFDGGIASGEASRGGKNRGPLGLSGAG